MTKRNYIKRLISLILAITIATGCFLYQPQKVQADDFQDVTDTLSQKDIDNLTTIATEPVLAAAAAVYLDTHNGKTKTFNFSKASHRRYVLKFTQSMSPFRYDYNVSAKTLSKRLFGCSTSKVKMMQGDFGDVYPWLGYGNSGQQYLYLWKEGKKLYVYYDLYYLDYSDYNNPVDCVGGIRVEVKRKSSAPNKWVIKNMKVSRD